MRCIESKMYGDIYNKQERITILTDPTISPSEEGADFFKTESENIWEPRKKKIKNVGDTRDAFALLCDKWIASFKENKKYNMYDNYEELKAYLIRNKEEPLSYMEAVNSDLRVNWLKAIKCEFDAHEKNGTWVLRRQDEIPSSQAILKSKWVFKRKEDLDKAKLVIKGYADKNFYDTTDVYVPVARLTDI